MRARLIVDGQTRLDNDLDEWHKTTTPPPFIAELIHPGHKTEPYLIAAAMALAEAAKQGNPITITINTDIHPSGWTMNVQHAYALTLQTTPEYCPGGEDPRCKGECTVNQVTGKIKDPDCFR